MDAFNELMGGMGGLVVLVLVVFVVWLFVENLTSASSDNETRKKK